MYECLPLIAAEAAYFDLHCWVHRQQLAVAHAGGRPLCRDCADEVEKAIRLLLLQLNGWAGA